MKTDMLQLLINLNLIVLYQLFIGTLYGFYFTNNQFRNSTEYIFSLVYCVWLTKKKLRNSLYHWSHVRCKRLASWSRVCPQTLAEVKWISICPFAWIHSRRWLVVVHLTIERRWRSAMFYDKVPYFCQMTASGVIYSFILK